MFTVYGVSGELFRGSMEQLRKIGAVGALARTTAIRSLRRDVHGPHLGSPEGIAEALSATPSVEVHRDAVAAYTQAKQHVPTRQPLTRVDALMSTEVITLPDTMTVLNAWKLLAEHGIGQAPVVNASAMLVGLLTRADLINPEQLPTPDSSAVAWRALLAQSVLDIMRTPVPSVTPDSDIRRVARVLLEMDLPGLAVVDDAGLVLGFVSRSDILRAVVTDPPLDLWG